MNTELQRMKALAVGEHWIADPALLLYAIVSNVSAEDVTLLRYQFDALDGRKPFPWTIIPTSAVEAVKLVYRVVGTSTDDGLKSCPEQYDLAAERVCDACISYLKTVMSPTELAEFQKTTPIRKFKSVMDDIRKMFHDFP
jgi:hypothetical protein